MAGTAEGEGNIVMRRSILYFAVCLLLAGVALVAPSAQARPLAPASTRLTLQIVGERRVGAEISVDTQLTTASGKPLAERLVDLYLDGKRVGRLKTNAAGATRFSLGRKLSAGTYQLKAIFETTGDWKSSSAAAQLVIAAPAPTKLTLTVVGEARLGEPTSVEALLVTSAGQPIAAQPINLFVNETRQGRLKTNEAGVARFNLGRKTPAGTYALTAEFEGSSAAQPTKATGQLAVAPAVVTIETVPAVPGVRFQLDDRVFTSGQDGFAHITVDYAGDYRLVILPWDASDARQLIFKRWQDQTFETERVINVSRSVDFEAGFDMTQRVQPSFADLSGHVVDPARITSTTFKGSNGTTVTFAGAAPQQLPVTRLTVRLQHLEAQDVQYYVQSVVVDGSNVVNQSQQRFDQTSGEQWPIELLLYSIQVKTRDAFFGMRVGTGVEVEYPNSTKVVLPLDEQASALIGPLARGAYKMRVVGASGIAPVTPVALSRDQTLDLLVITDFNVAITLVVLITIALGLLFWGRPQILSALHIYGRPAPAGAMASQRPAWGLRRRQVLISLIVLAFCLGIAGKVAASMLSLPLPTPRQSVALVTSTPLPSVAAATATPRAPAPTSAAPAPTALPSAAPEPTEAAPQMVLSISRTLKFKSEGPEVVALQQRLRELRFFAYPENTGYYGEATVTAIKSFQSARALPVTGITDEPTVAALNACDQECAQLAAEGAGSNVVNQ